MNSETQYPKTAEDIGPAVIRRAGEGDNAAFRHIVDCYKERIHAIAWRITGNSDDALDIAQDAFVRLYEALRNSSITENPGAWLYRVTVNAAIDNRRRAFRYQQIELEREPEHPTGRTSRPDITAENRETADIIRKLVTELPEKQAQVFTLRDIEGVPVPEIGVILGCAENTVRVHLSRARLALRTMLKKRYPHLLTPGSDQS